MKPQTTFLEKIALILLGIFIFLILMEVGLRLGGFIFLSLQRYSNRCAIQKKGSYRILCLGESTTASGPYPYPMQLEKILCERKPEIKFSVINVGIPAVTTTDILARLEHYLDLYKPDMVITMMGINDQGSHMPGDNLNTGIGSFLRHFQVYKFAGFLMLRITTKANAQKTYNNKPDRQIVPIGERPFLPFQPQYDRGLSPKGHQEKEYIDSGTTYMGQGEYVKAEEDFQKALAFNPESYFAYLGLARSLQYQVKYDEAEKSIEKAIDINPTHDRAYIELGWLFRSTGNESKAEELFTKAITINPQNETPRLELISIYMLQGKYTQAEANLKHLLQINPHNAAVYHALELVYEKMAGEQSVLLLRKKSKTANDYYAEITKSNFLKVKRILDQRHIQLVCVQYPMRDTEPLKTIFEGQSGIIFVDNESLFRQALKVAPIKKYFTDMFAGDFGHCTPQGNRILATNIADTIIKTVFNQRFKNL